MASAGQTYKGYDIAELEKAVNDGNYWTFERALQSLPSWVRMSRDGGKAAAQKIVDQYAGEYAAKKAAWDEFNKAPAVDTRYPEVQKQQLESAKRFRDSIPLYAKSLMAGKEQAGRRELASSLVNADKAANRRGLLYGGTRAKARTDARQKNAQELASQRAELNQGLGGVADKLEQNAIDTGFGMAGQGQQASSAQQATDMTALERRMREGMRSDESTSDFISSLGGLVGKAAGSK